MEDMTDARAREILRDARVERDLDDNRSSVEIAQTFLDTGNTAPRVAERGAVVTQALTEVTPVLASDGSSLPTGSEHLWPSTSEVVG